MAAIKFLRLSKPLGLGFSKEVLSSSTFSSMGSGSKTLTCLSKVGLSSNTLPTIGGGERKPVAVKAVGSASSACVLISDQKTTDKVVDLALLLTSISNAMSLWLNFITKQRPWRFHIQMFIEKVIIDCRFFVLLAIAGSLLGSVLCFVEGCFLILESYIQYFHAISQISEHVTLLLIEAIGMFLVGTAMLIFGMALHIMFVGTKNLQSKGSNHSASTLSKNFNLEKLSSWIRMESVMQAKSKIGHAVIMILQVEVLEKFKSISISNGLDLACFAGVVFLSSASIFILSRISVAPAQG